MPPDLEVYFADHDQSEFETNNIVRSVYHVDPMIFDIDEASDYEYQRKDYNTPDDYEYIVLRP